MLLSHCEIILQKTRFFIFPTIKEVMFGEKEVLKVKILFHI